MEDCFTEAMQEIKAALQDSPLWLSVDKTTNATGCAVGKVLLGKLDHDHYHRPFLVNCSFMDRTDSSTIARLVNDTLRLITPNFNVDLLKVLLTDAASYMVKTGHELRVFFPSMMHITCLARALHRVCETARGAFQDVNSLISRVFSTKIYMCYDFGDPWVQN